MVTFHKFTGWRYMVISIGENFTITLSLNTSSCVRRVLPYLYKEHDEMGMYTFGGIWRFNMSICH